MIPSFRLIELHERFSKGEHINKKHITDKYRIDSKTFQRDIDKLRLYYSEKCIGEIIYNRKRQYYYLDSHINKLTKQEIFAICKILIESRAFNKNEFIIILNKVLKLASMEDYREINKAINNEKVNYIELLHGKTLVNEIWQLRQYITDQRVVIIDYQRADKVNRKHKIKPVGIVFSEYYFYLLALPMDNMVLFPIVYRVDRIINIKETNQMFTVPYREKFSESEFKLKTSYMYSGELRLVRFEYRGILEALMDKFPSAIIEKKIVGGVIVKVEAFSKGLEMWILSQGDNVKILKVD